MDQPLPAALAQQPRSTFLNVADSVSAFLGYVAAIATFLMMAFSAYDITARYLFNEPTSWVVEVSGYLLVAIAFLGAGYAEKQNAHIKVDLVLQAFQGKALRFVQSVAAWLGTIFVFFAAWQTALFNYSDYKNGTRFWVVLETLQWIPELPMTIGFAGLALAMLATVRRLSPPLGSVRSIAVPVLLVALIAALILMGDRPVHIGLGKQELGAALILGTVLISAWLWSGARVGIALLVIVTVLIASYVALAGGSPKTAMVLVVTTLVALLLTGMSISLGLGLLGLLGIAFLLPIPQFQAIGERAYSSANSFSLTAVPMFVLMGVLLLRSGVSSALFEAMRIWFGRVPGGLAHASIATSAGFAAVSGSSVATAATIGGMAAPEMISRGYSPRLAYGSIAAGGTLGILIPPSIPMIIYGSMVGASVSALFVAGVIPGLVLSLLFMAVIAVWSIVFPQSAPAGTSYTLGHKFRSSLGALPFVVLIFLVMGSLYWGVATPSEAGAVGAVLAMAVCILMGKLNFQTLVESLLETVQTTSFIIVILVGTATFTYIVDYLRLSQELIQIVGGMGLTPFQVFCVVSVVYIILGMFIDPISMMLITLPVTFPMIKAAGFDPVWFGIYLVVMIEVGLLTPPVGMNLFVLRGLSGEVSLQEIAIGAAPFLVIIFAFVGLIYVYPEIITWLPDRMGMPK
ncbi:MAG: TRAP transporter large permease subunit [Hyphomicrobiaceae bacterium]